MEVVKTANNEEKRILVLEADKSNLNQFIFDLSWEHLDKVKGNEISRSEAIEKMARAILKADTPENNENDELLRLKLNDTLMVKICKIYAEAALGALLSKDKE